MEQIGFVEKLKGNTATVFVRRTSSCGDKCHTCKGSCNIKGIRININTDIKIQEGDYVEIVSETKNILKYAFIAYGIPLIIMILSLVVFINILNNNAYKEIIAGLISIATLFISSYILRFLDKKIAKSKEISYFINRKL